MMTIEDIKEYKKNAVAILEKNSQYATARAVEEAFDTLAILEQLKITVEKQTDKNVFSEDYLYGKIYYCPCCGEYIGKNYNEVKDIEFCKRCGQKITVEQ